MKSTAVITLAAVTLAVAGCTTSDPTPPGSLGALSEAEENDEAQGIPNEEEHEGEGAAEGEGAEGESETEGEAEGEAGESAEGETEGEGGQTEGEAGEESVQPPPGPELPDPAQLSNETCIAFFDGAAPLAGRAHDARFLVSRGADNNLSALEFQEVDVVAQRLDELSALGSDEQAELIEAINAPFTGVQRAADEEDGQDAESGEVSYESIDIEEAEQAQDEFTQACLADS